MATITITPGNSFTATETVTSTKLNDLGSPTAALDAGTIVNADVSATADISGSKLADATVTKAKIENVADYKVLGNVSGAAAAPQEVAILDEDDMVSNSDTALATQQSIKAYADGTVSTSENGYMKLPSGVIMQWGTLTPSAQLTDVTLPIAFPNACLNVQSSIGEDFTDTSYTDNSLIWGGYPKSGDLSKITIMSNLRLSNSGITYKKMFWQAIGY